jgi:hypothetical protein
MGTPWKITRETLWNSHGKPDGKPVENHVGNLEDHMGTCENYMGNLWKITLEPVEKHMGSLCKNTAETSRKSYGRHWEPHGKPMDNHMGKPVENHVTEITWEAREAKESLNSCFTEGVESPLSSLKGF